MFVFMDVKVQDFVRVKEDKGEQIIDYNAMILPCCIEGWGFGNFSQNIKKDIFQYLYQKGRVPTKK